MTVYFLFKPFDVQIDGNGIPMAGATLTFYQTGTLTLQSTYADGGGMSANVNPVVADSNGLWPPIYLASGFDYKVLLKTSAGVTVATRDPVEAPAAPIVNTAQPLRSYLAGLGLSAAGSSAIFSVAAGVAADSTTTVLITLMSALTKTTASWFAGSGNGALDTGTISNNVWYAVYLIEDSGTGAVDVIFSLNTTVPTLPTGYTLYRRIGYMKTDGSAQWIAFTQYGNEFYWATPVNDANGAGMSTSSRTARTLSVPPNTIAIFNFYCQPANSSAAEFVLLTSADQTDQAASGTMFSFFSGPTGTGSPGSGSGDYRIKVNGSSQMYDRDNQGSGAHYMTRGWVDTRGRDA